MHLPQDRLSIVQAGSAGKDGSWDHSQKQGFLGGMLARSFESELKKIRLGKTIRFGGSCLVAARKDF